MDCRSCGKSIPNDSVFCPYCKKQVRKADAPIADKIKKKIGKPAKGTDAPVDLEVRKTKKRLLLIGIPVVIIILSGVFLFLYLGPEDPPPPEIPVFNVFSDPLPKECPFGSILWWNPGNAVDELIWGDYIIELPEYVQLQEGASLVDDQSHIGENVDLTEFLAGMTFKEMAMDQGADKVSILPLRMVTGPNNVNHRYVRDLEKEGYGFITYSVYSESNQNISHIGKPYKVEGNKIIIYPEWWHSGEPENIVEVYTDETIEFEFHFEGFSLILERDGLSVKLVPRQLVADADPWIVVSHQVSGGLEFADITYIEHVASPYMQDGTIRAGDGSFISFDAPGSKSFDDPD